jgi:hypothetical protein
MMRKSTFTNWKHSALRRRVRFQACVNIDIKTDTGNLRKWDYYGEDGGCTNIRRSEAS